MTDSVIQFYDIPSNLGARQAWSPSTWRTRLALNYKGLPYKTTWVEFPDIEKICKEIGAAATSIRNGKPRYTLPVIHDPSTGKTVSDSLAIAKYLDDQYPDTPKLLPPGTTALQLAFADACHSRILSIGVFSVPASYKILNPGSQPWFRETRESAYSKTLQEFAPEGGAREEAWTKVRDAMGAIDGWIQEGGGPFVMGNTVSSADFVLVAALLYFKRVFGEDSEEWKDIRHWNEGRWEERLHATEEYQNEDK